MKKATVTIDLEDYLQIKEFYDNFTKKKRKTIIDPSFYCGSKWISDDESMEKLSKINEDLELLKNCFKDENIVLKKKITELENELKVSQDTINSIYRSPFPKEDKTSEEVKKRYGHNLRKFFNL